MWSLSYSEEHLQDWSQDGYKQSQGLILTALPGNLDMPLSEMHSERVSWAHQTVSSLL